jgi:mono/diheme cytochrome c family protein
MHTTRRKLSLAIGLGSLLLGAGGTASAQQAAYESALAELKQHWQTLETYCTDCHNLDDYAGGIDFTLLSPAVAAQEAETFELALKKLRGNVMPPPSQQQPSQQERWALIASLEKTLDTHSTLHPDPGTVGLHRLNRTEYVNAIYEITGVKLDAELALPKDDNSDGFDNIARVLKISPTFLDQYIAAARSVADQAVGSSNPRNDTVFYRSDSSHQAAHVHGLPLGTRGGVVVEHIFPVDGEYTLTIPGMAGAGYTLGMEYEHTVIVTLDGQKIFERSIGGGEDLRKLDQEQAPAVAEINGRFKDIPITVSSGPHKIGVAFVARSFAESDEFLHSLEVNRGMDRIARMPGVQVTGPLKSGGVINTPSRQKVMICEPQAAAQEQECARQIFANLAKQAFRRPITDDDLVAPLRFYAEGRELGDFDNGIRNGMMAIFTSPKFLFRAEFAPEGAAPGEVVALSDLELASRLSFFLWSTVPDATLLDLAARDELSKGNNLQQQVERMLADERAGSLVDNFVFQWLRLRELDNIDPDPEVFANYRPGLLDAFEDEIRFFVGDLIKQNTSVLDLMTSDYTWLNEDLALHYGITNVKGDHFRKVRLASPERSGLLGKGAVLMVTSYANRTTPVIRGAYVMENFQGVPPAAPPPNVEAFPETPEGATVALTVRERLEQHRDNPACAGCHDVMDPLGLSLENFNAIGEWRERDSDAGNVLIDASGNLADGTPLHGVNELRAALVARPDQFAQVFTEKLLMYALGRGVEAHDMPAVRKIVHGASADNYSFAALIKGVIDSEQFRKITVPADAVLVGSTDTTPR